MDNLAIKTQRLLLRTPELEDANLLKDFYMRNLDHFAPWITIRDNPPEEVFTARIAEWHKHQKENIHVRFFLFLEDELIGACGLSQIIYGCFRACYLGYEIGQQHQGKGLMAEALQAVLRYAFEELKLHRIMANYMPHNVRSAQLLQRMGFEVEGLARNYLMINERWQDHVLTALSFERWADHG